MGTLAAPYTAPMPDWMNALLQLLALPQYSLGTVFVVAFVSATLVPLGSEPVVFGLVQLNPGLFWPVVLVATLGNTLGGAVDWWMGYGAHRAVDHYRHSTTHLRALDWLQRLGPKACLLSWLPAVGDPALSFLRGGPGFWTTGGGGRGGFGGGSGGFSGGGGSFGGGGASGRW